MLTKAVHQKFGGLADEGLVFGRQIDDSHGWNRVLRITASKLSDETKNSRPALRRNDAIWRNDRSAAFDRLRVTCVCGQMLASPTSDRNAR